jgi:hypothetical protein
MALTEHCKIHTQINLTRAYAQEESEGSMASDTDNEDANRKIQSRQHLSAIDTSKRRMSY